MPNLNTLPTLRVVMHSTRTRETRWDAEEGVTAYPNAFTAYQTFLHGSLQGARQLIVPCSDRFRANGSPPIVYLMWNKQ